MLKPVSIKIDQIYVPMDRLKELNIETVNVLAEEIIATKTKTPSATNSNADAKPVIHPPPRSSSSSTDVVLDPIPKFEGFPL